MLRMMGFARLRHGIKSSVMVGKLRTAYPQPRKVMLYRLKPLSFGDCRVHLSSSMADFASLLVDVIFI